MKDDQTMTVEIDVHESAAALKLIDQDLLIRRLTRTLYNVVAVAAEPIDIFGTALGPEDRALWDHACAVARASGAGFPLVELFEPGEETPTSIELAALERQRSPEARERAELEALKHAETPKPTKTQEREIHDRFMTKAFGPSRLAEVLAGAGYSVIDDDGEEVSATALDAIAVRGLSGEAAAEAKLARLEKLIETTFENLCARPILYGDLGSIEGTFRTLLIVELCLRLAPSKPLEEAHVAVRDAYSASAEKAFPGSSLAIFCSVWRSRSKDKPARLVEILKGMRALALKS